MVTFFIKVSALRRAQEIAQTGTHDDVIEYLKTQFATIVPDHYTLHVLARKIPDVYTEKKSWSTVGIDV